MPGSKPGERRGGRQKGTPNKRTRELRERLDTLGCDPVEGLARLAMDESLKPELRAKCYSDLLPYCYPKRRALELSKGGRDVPTMSENTAVLLCEITKGFNAGPELTAKSHPPGAVEHLPTRGKTV